MCSFFTNSLSFLCKLLKRQHPLLKCIMYIFSIPSLQSNNWTQSGWSIRWSFWIWVGHECKCCFHHSRHLIYATKLNIMKSLGISQYLSNGGGGVGEWRILVRSHGFQGKQMGDHSVQPSQQSIRGNYRKLTVNYLSVRGEKRWWGGFWNLVPTNSPPHPPSFLIAK